MRIAVFVSGGGTNLQAIIDHIHSGYLADVNLVKVIASRESIYALERAAKHHISSAVISRKSFVSLEDYDQAVIHELGPDQIDLVVLAGFMTKLGPSFFARYPRVINIHPSLIPAFCGQGMYGLNVHQSVLEHGEKITGATVHFVNEEYDAGPIFLQKTVLVHEGDTPEILQKRVMKECEQILLPQAIRLLADQKMKQRNGEGKSMKRRAIISVFDKTGIADLVRKLISLDIEIISTGGTAALLRKEGLDVLDVSDVTGFPECLDGRLKTLHPKIHGGILAMRDHPEHMDKMKELGIESIDFVIINLYPFKETMMKPDANFESCVEMIDIGGPTMLRAAAKNHRDVTVITDPIDYELVIAELKEHKETSSETRFRLAGKVFEHTAAYDTLIANYFLSKTPEVTYPNKLSFTYEKIVQMRYGENPHQRASFYSNAIPVQGSLPLAEQLNGKELSYNNIADTDACIAILREFTDPTVVAVKHANPCGVGSADHIFEAWQKAYEADSVSIFGGIVSANREIDEDCARGMIPVFLEVVVAPSYTPEALEILKSKKNLRILKLPSINDPQSVGQQEIKMVAGGILVQDKDQDDFDVNTWKSVTDFNPEENQYKDLQFAMKVVKHTKSNAIVLAKNQQTVGIGPGQPNRITSVEIAIKQAGTKSKGAVMSSDAFFPFKDCVQAAGDAGISCIIQPGGSIRDEESIKECNERKIPMVFTGKRHFKH